MGYTPLHRAILDAVQLNLVTYYNPGEYHLIARILVHPSVKRGLAYLRLGGYTTFGQDAKDGTTAVLLTPLGVGALRRWTGEQGLVERTGGAE